MRTHAFAFMFKQPPREKKKPKSYGAKTKKTPEKQNPEKKTKTPHLLQNHESKGHPKRHQLKPVIAVAMPFNTRWTVILYWSSGSHPCAQTKQNAVKRNNVDWESSAQRSERCGANGDGLYVQAPSRTNRSLASRSLRFSSSVTWSLPQ